MVCSIREINVYFMGVISHENSIDCNNFMQVGRLLCGFYAMNFFPLRAHLIGERENRGEKYAWLGGKEQGEGVGGEE